MNEIRPRHSNLFFKKRGFWEILDPIATLGAMVSSGVAAASNPGEKWPAIKFAIGFGVTVAISKISAKTIEWQTARVKARDDLARERAENTELAAKDARIEVLQEALDTRTRLIIFRVVDYFWSRYFNKVARRDRARHRATLFKCVEFDGPAGRAKRLEIYARKGAHPESTCVWPLDDNEPTKCRGIAGQIWTSGVVRIFEAECEWGHTDDSKLRHAESLSMTVEDGERLNIKGVTLDSGDQAASWDQRPSHSRVSAVAISAAMPSR